MVDFAKLKQSSGKKALEDLTSKLTKLEENNNNRSSKDDRYWTPTVDKAGNGYAIIRFLPAFGDEDVPFVKLWDHGFQGVGGWYIENSLTTLGKDDPVSEYNSVLWKSSNDDESPERKQVRVQKRRLHYIANIYVVHDSGAPEKEGKVYLYKFGKKIYDKINDVMYPQFPDDAPMNPFDLWEGANFKLKIRKQDGYRNYDKSEFDKAGPLSEDDEELEKIYKSEYSLKEVIDPKNFKTYDELKALFLKAITPPGSSPKAADPAKEEQKSSPSPSFKQAAAPKFSEDEIPFDVGTTNDEDDDTMEFFKKLASD